MSYELWYFDKDSIRVVSFDHKLSNRLNRWLGYPYEQGSLVEGDEPVFKVPAAQWIKLNKILKS
jgi:hypothetical protein